jgi:hypothetical protein
MRQLPWLFLALTLLAQASGAAQSDLVREWPATIPQGPELEAAGAVIGRIEVIPGDIFDPSIPSESGWLYRTANKLHINTRPKILADQLLFKSGERYVHRVIEETERILRGNDYLYDAVIVPRAWDGHTVDLEVRTRDTWTLNPGINYSREGGENETAISLEEKNLLGGGKKLAVAWSNDVDRESLDFDYFDPHFNHTWTQIGLAYSDADDGSTQALRVNRPFYALDTRRAGGVQLLVSERDEPRYAYGDEVGKFEQEKQFYEIFGGWSAGWEAGWVRRWTAGVTYDDNRFRPVVDEPLAGPLPEDRKLVYPWLGFELVQDMFQRRTNQDQIDRTEDVLIGLRAGGRLGFATESIGADRDALILSAYVQDGWDLRPGDSLFVGATATGRVESEGLRNAVLAAEARYYNETSKRTKFFATLNGTVTEELDADKQLVLGGDNGLRGYPLRYQAGTSSALLTLEQRYYTDW